MEGTKIYYQLLLVSLCSSAALAARHRTDGCALNANGKNEKFLPLILTNSTSEYKFVLTERGSVLLQPNQEVLLSCPDNKNKLNNTNRSLETIKCVDGETIKIGRRNVNFSETICNKAIKGDAIETNNKCASNKGYIHNIGYHITSNNWITLFQVCYDRTEGKSLYAEHVLYGQQIKYASGSTYRPSFSAQGVASDLPASLAYKRAYQKSTFNRILGSSRISERYINNSSYLSRGHLAPDADFLYAPWQYTTYYYINTAPQWQAINGGNWVKIENSLRRFADNYGKILNVYTGTHDVLKLPDENGDLKPIYLARNDKLPVPKFFWKIIFDAESRKAIVLVASNNPFLGDLTEEDYLCSDICREYGWNKNYFSKKQYGFVHCCDYNEFVEVVRTAPSLNVRSILEKN